MNFACCAFSLRVATALVLTTGIAVTAGCGSVTERLTGTIRQARSDSVKAVSGLPKFTQVDYQLWWSPDGRAIAFRRAVPSSLGPAGLYVIARKRDRPRFVRHGNLFWPNEVKFSPDGQRVVGVDNFRIFIADLRTGVTTYPVYTANGINFVDWSPDGRHLLLSRMTAELDQPLDSAGVHIYDLVTGVDRPVIIRGQHIFGRYVRWAPDGRRFAIADFADGWNVSVYNLADSSKVTIWRGTRADQFVNLQWVRGGPGQILRLAFEKDSGPLQGSYLADPDGQNLERLPVRLQYYDLYSPGRRELLTSDWQVPDSVGVLFIRKLAPGIPIQQQLTWWSPPR